MLLIIEPFSILRVGDDEQSDWIGDVGLATGGNFSQNDRSDVTRDDGMYSTYHNYLGANFENAPSEDKKSGKLFSERVILPNIIIREEG